MAQLLSLSNSGRPDRKADVVFVHGLDGDARSTWQIGRSADGFWPDWLGADLPDIGIWSVGYDASSSAWRGYAMPLEDRAINVLALLESYKLGIRPLVFIAHSLGGLVVKQMLRTAHDSTRSGWKSIQAQTKGIVFLATPHSGSHLANLVRWIPLLRTTVSVNDLLAHSPHSAAQPLAPGPPSRARV